MSVEPSPEDQERLTCLWIWLVGRHFRETSFKKSCLCRSGVRAVRWLGFLGGLLRASGS